MLSIFFGFNTEHPQQPNIQSNFNWSQYIHVVEGHTEVFYWCMITWFYFPWNMNLRTEGFAWPMKNLNRLFSLLCNKQNHPVENAKKLWCYRIYINKTLLKVLDLCISPNFRLPVFIKMFNRNLRSQVWKCHVGVPRSRDPPV